MSLLNNRVRLFQLFFLIIVFLLLQNGHSAYAASLQAMCPSKILETNTVEGIFEGTECADNCFATIRLDSGELFSFFCDEEEAEKVFGAVGNRVSVTYNVEQFWRPEGDEEDSKEGFCQRVEVFKSGTILVGSSPQQTQPATGAVETFENLTCEQIADIKRSFNPDGERTQRLFTQYGIKKALADMGEQEGTFLFKAWKECEKNGNTGGVSFMFEQDAIQPLLWSAEAQKKRRNEQQKMEKYLAQLDDIKKDVTNPKMSIEMLEKRLNECRAEITNDKDYTLVLSDLDSVIREIHGKIENRAINEGNATFMQEIASLKKWAESASKLEDVEKLRSFNSVNFSEHIATLPLTPASRNALSDLQITARNTSNKICEQAAQSLCAELVPDLDKKYKDYALTIDGELPLWKLVCAAKNNGAYKKFSSGGLLSNAITLELQHGTIYFRAARINTQTLVEVADSFSGPHVVDFLIATEFVSTNGKKSEIDSSASEMQLLLMRLGGLPQAPECAR